MLQYATICDKNFQKSVDIILQICNNLLINSAPSYKASTIRKMLKLGAFALKGDEQGAKSCNNGGWWVFPKKICSNIQG